MTAFSYLAIDPDGRERSGVVEAESPRLARTVLREQGLLPVNVVPVTQLAQHPAGGRGRRIALPALAAATREWSSLLDAGVSIEHALNAVIEQGEDAKVRAIFAGVRAEILSGNSLHQALEAFPAAFPPLFRAVVGAGERSGELPQLLERLASYLETGLASRRRLAGALLYPAVLMFVALAVIATLMIFVVPQIVAVFQNGKQQLPLLTRLLIEASDLLRLLAPFAIVIVPLSLWGFFRWLKNLAFRRRWQAWLLALPGFGRLYRLRETERFASTLAILVESGVPLIDALQAAAQVISALPLQDVVLHAIQKVREGVPLHRALAEGQAFPPLLLHLIASGESSGRLDRALTRAAAQHQGELDRRSGLAMSLVEPVLILVMGGIVMLIVLAILLPIVNINLLLR